MLHGWHHSVALGQPEPIVWALMVWDSLWVGLMAALTGSALFVGYRCGPDVERVERQAERARLIVTPSDGTEKAAFGRRRLLHGCKKRAARLRTAPSLRRRFKTPAKLAKKLT
jgi:hypothetical protein